jgi:hypothetical protein
MNAIRSYRLQIALVSAGLILLGALFNVSPVAAQAGGAALWINTISSPGEDIVRGVAADKNGDVIVAGVANGRDGFVAKYSAGGAFVWVRSFGNTGIHAGVTQANDVAVDAFGSVFVIGTFSGQTDFDPGPGETSLTSNGDEDIFVLKLDAGGNFVWATALGGRKSDSGEAIFVDVRGFVYTTGSFEGEMDVDPDPDRTLMLYSQGEDDIFVVRYSNSGELRRAWSMGGSQDAVGRDIAVDGAGNVFIAGDFLGRIDLDHNNTTDEHRSEGHEDIFVVKYNDNAGWVWSAVVGGRGEDERPAVAVDRSGNVYLTGTFEVSANVKAKGTVYTLVSRGQEDFFLLMLDSAGNFVWAEGIGGPGADRGEDILVDGRGDLHVTGSFRGPVDFDPGPGQTLLTSANDSSDVFVGRYASGGQFYAVRAFSGPQEAIGYALARDAASNLIVGGSFQGTVDFDPSAGSDTRTAMGGRDGFAVKLARDETRIGDEAVFLPYLSLGAPAVSLAWGD